MIINNTLFVNEYYLPHAKPSITSDVTTVSAEVDGFIKRYVREALMMSLGKDMANELIGELKVAPTDMDDLLKDASAQKWKDLMYGQEYVDANGDNQVWRGIVFKEFGSDVFVSILTPFVFWHFEQNADTFRGGAGTAVPEIKNARVISANSKVTKAMRDFVEYVQGKESRPDIINKNGFIGVDWYLAGASHEISLYRYILDKNELGKDDETVSFNNFSGRVWRMPNQFGI